MKKILTAMVLFVFIALPMSVMAMTTLADNDLSTVTGQAGVSIGADITMNVSFGTVAWGDSDGLGTGTTGGWVGLRNGKIENLRIHMRSDLGMLDTVKAADYITQFPSYSLTAEDSQVLSALLTNQFLTIDVYTQTTTSTIWQSDGIGAATQGSGYKTFVRIGVPTFEIDMAKFTAEVGLWNDGPNLWEDFPGPLYTTFQKMGNIYVSNMIALLGKDNFIDISANNTQSGILISVGNTTGVGAAASHNLVDKVTFEAMAWGDDDGLGGDTSLPVKGGGYIGLTAVDIEAIKVTATVNINVCTPTGYNVNALLSALRAAETAGNIVDDMSTIKAFVDLKKVDLQQGNKTAAGIAIKDSLAYLFHLAGIIGTTSVDIGLDNVYVNIGSLVANAALSKATADMNLADASGVNKNLLGQIYMKDLTLVIPAYNTGVTSYTDGDGHVFSTAPHSWVSISAH